MLATCRLTVCSLSAEARGDRRIAEALGDQRQHLALAGAEPREVRLGRRRAPRRLQMLLGHQRDQRAPAGRSPSIASGAALGEVQAGARRRARRPAPSREDLAGPRRAGDPLGDVRGDARRRRAVELDLADVQPLRQRQPRRCRRRAQRDGAARRARRPVEAQQPASPSRRRTWPPTRRAGLLDRRAEALQRLAPARGRIAARRAARRPAAPAAPPAPAAARRAAACRSGTPRSRRPPRRRRRSRADGRGPRSSAKRAPGMCRAR